MKRLVLQAIRDIGLDTPNVDCIVAHKLMDPALLYEYVHSIAEELRHRRAAVEDARQGWLALPEYQHIPVEAANDTLEDLRARIARLEKRIKHYDYARRSPVKLKEDKRQLRELKRLEPKVATYFASDPEMKLDRAVQMHMEYLETPPARHNRRIAKAAISKRWARTKNQ